MTDRNSTSLSSRLQTYREELKTMKTLERQLRTAFKEQVFTKQRSNREQLYRDAKKTMRALNEQVKKISQQTVVLERKFEQVQNKLENRMKEIQELKATERKKAHERKVNSNQVAKQTKELRQEKLYTEAKLAFIQCFNKKGWQEETMSRRQQVEIILELRDQYSLPVLLKVAGLARSVFYYHYNAIRNNVDKYAVHREMMHSIFEESHGLYGVRRLTQALKERGYPISRLTVYKLMKEEGISGPIPGEVRSLQGKNED